MEPEQADKGLSLEQKKIQKSNEIARKQLAQDLPAIGAGAVAVGGIGAVLLKNKDRLGELASQRKWVAVVIMFAVVAVLFVALELLFRLSESFPYSPGKWAESSF